MSQNPFLPTTSGLVPNANVTGTPGAITATSSTPQTIGIGNLSFQVPTQAVWAPGMFVSIVSAANNTNYMTGTVVSYSNTTLVVDVSVTGGSGTYSDWLINLSGANGGAQGPAGPTGATGAAGANAGPVGGSVQGLKVTNNASTPSTKIDVSAVSATMVNTGGTSVRSLAVAVTIDLTTGTSSAAANGMDGEARGTSAWMYLYLINNGSVTAGLATKASPLAGAPTLPSGYASYTYIGAMYVDGSGNLMRTLQLGNETHYVVTATTNTAALPVLANGAAGNTSTPTWSAVATGSAVPATANDIIIAANTDVGGTPVTVIVAPNNAYGNATSTNPPPVAIAAGAVSATIPLETTNIYWASGGTDGYLFCLGWHDYVATI